MLQGNIGDEERLKGMDFDMRIMGKADERGSHPLGPNVTYSTCASLKLNHKLQSQPDKTFFIQLSLAEVCYLSLRRKYLLMSGICLLAGRSDRTSITSSV